MLEINYLFYGACPITLQGLNTLVLINSSKAVSHEVFHKWIIRKFTIHLVAMALFHNSNFLKIIYYSSYYVFNMMIHCLIRKNMRQL